MAKKPSPEPMEAVTLRNEYIQADLAQQRKLTGKLMIIISVTLVVIITLLMAEPEVRVVARDPDGSIVPVIAPSEPMVTPEALNDWASRVVTATYTYSFRDWREKFSALKRDFTSRGWGSFTRALERSNMLEVVRNDQVFVSSVPLGAPIVVREGVMDDGRYAWRLEIPLRVTYEGASNRRTQDLLIELLVVRANLLEHRSGLAVQQFVGRDR